MSLCIVSLDNDQSIKKNLVDAAGRTRQQTFLEEHYLLRELHMLRSKPQPWIYPDQVKMNHITYRIKELEVKRIACDGMMRGLRQ